jgi:glutathione S-transferase
MPVVSVNDDFIGQSLAIYFYLATENGLMGQSVVEAAQILSVYEHLRELKLAYLALVPNGQEPSIDAHNKWFDEGALDTSGVADSSQRSTRFLKWYMGRIENSLQSKGFAVGSNLSLADILLYHTFAESLKESEVKNKDFPQFKREPFGNKARVEDALLNYPKIAGSVATVKNNENFQKWLNIRGPQGF